MSAARAYAARVAVDARAAASATEVAGGVLLSTPELPTIWDLNQVLLAPGADTALLEQALHTLPEDTRRITVFDPADPIGPQRGWNLSTCVLMVAGEEATAWPDGVETVAPPALRDAQALMWKDEFDDPPAHLIAMLDRFAAFPGYQNVAARSGDDYVAWAAIANGCIDDVWVQPQFRGRGLGRAVTQAALAAGGWFLWTEAGDPVPQGLYRSLGMRDIGTVVQLTRDPG